MSGARSVAPEYGSQAVRGTSDDRTSWFNGSVVSDDYRQLALAIVLRSISRFFTGLASLALAPKPAGDQRNLAAIPRSV